MGIGMCALAPARARRCEEMRPLANKQKTLLDEPLPHRAQTHVGSRCPHPPVLTFVVHGRWLGVLARTPVAHIKSNSGARQS